MKVKLKTIKEVRRQLEMNERPGDCVVLLNSLNHHPIPMNYVEPINLSDHRVIKKINAILAADDYQTVIDHLKRGFSAIIVAGCFDDETTRE